MIEDLVKGIKFFSQIRVQPRFLEQSMVVVLFKGYFQDRVQQRFLEQNMDMELFKV